MKKITTLFIILPTIFALYTFSTIFEAPMAEAASSETTFGGMQELSLDEYICDCGGNSHYVYDYKTNNMLILYKAPQSKFFEYYLPSGTYQLGTYSSSASEDCDMYVYEDCETISYNEETYGYTPGTGVSL